MSIRVLFIYHGITFLASQSLINAEFSHGEFALRQVYDTNFGYFFECEWKPGYEEKITWQINVCQVKKGAVKMVYNIYFYDSERDAVVVTDMDGKQLVIDCKKAETQVIFDEP